MTINTQELKTRINKFLAEFGIPKTEFCKRVDVSTQSLRLWLKDKLTFSEATLERINKYLSKYGF